MTVVIQRMDNVGIVVDDLEDVVSRLRSHGAELVGGTRGLDLS